MECDADHARVVAARLDFSA
jgi:hypothetical protein